MSWDVKARARGVIGEPPPATQVENFLLLVLGQLARLLQVQGEQSMIGYEHGKHDCSLCLKPGSQLITDDGQWQLTHWPAYWGSSSPETLVLGFSMGANQVRAVASKPFDQVAFDRLRGNLAKILDTLGVPRLDQSMDELLTARAKGFGFSSIARCSLGIKEAGVFKTSGKIMSVAVDDPWASQVLSRCASTYLGNMPASVRRVVLLGNSDAYIKGMRRLLNRLFDDYASINPMAFRAAGRTWAFTVHPAAQGNRVKEWLADGEDQSSGLKREQAIHAIRRSLEGDPVKAATTIGRRSVFKTPRPT